MSVTSKTAGNTNKCCDSIDSIDIANQGEEPGTTVTREYCFGDNGEVTCSWMGSSPGEAIAGLFSNLSRECQEALADDLDSKINQLVESRDNYVISNTNLQCPPGSCREVTYQISMNGNNNGEFEACCQDGNLAGGGSGGQGNSPGDPGLNLAPSDFGSCS